jgi:signal peptidase II
MIKNKRYFLIGVCLVFCVIALDQWTKSIILDLFQDPQRQIPVASFFDIVLTWNKGVSFRLFNSYGDAGTYTLIILALLISVGLIIWLTRSTNVYLSCGLGLIIGGAIGNLIDRFYFKAVIDFLYFHLASFSWPAFNVADIAITLGVGFMILETVMIKKGDQRA